MSSPSYGENTPEGIFKEALLMEERDGIKERRVYINGWVGRFIDDLIRLWPLLLAIGLWVIRVEVFVQQGGRYTPEMHQAESAAIVEEAWEQARDEFVGEEVYGRDREHLEENLMEIRAGLARLDIELKEFRREIREHHQQEGPHR